MIRAVFCSLVMFQMGTSASAEEPLEYNIAGVANRAAVACDETLLDALRLEATFTVCLAYGDPTCIQSYLKNTNFSVLAELQKEKRDFGVYLSQIANSSRISSFKSDLPGYFNSLILGKDQIPTDARKEVMVKVHEVMQFGFDPAVNQELSEVMGSLVGKGTDLATLFLPGVAGTAVRAFKILMGDEDQGREPIEDLSCAVEGSLFIPAKTGKDPGDSCHAIYYLGSHRVQEFMKQPLATQMSLLKSKTTCGYYNQLLMTTHFMNRSILSKLTQAGDFSNFQCAGTGSVSFLMKSGDLQYEVHSTSPNVHSKVPRMTFRLTHTPHPTSSMIEEYRVGFVKKSAGYLVADQIQSRMSGQDKFVPAQNGDDFWGMNKREGEFVKQGLIAAGIAESCCSGKASADCIDGALRSLNVKLERARPKPKPILNFQKAPVIK